MKARKVAESPSGSGIARNFSPGIGGEHLLDRRLVLPLRGDDPVELPELGEAEGALELVHPVIEAEDRPAVQRPADGGEVVVAVVVVPLGAVVEVEVVR